MAAAADPHTVVLAVAVALGDPGGRGRTIADRVLRSYVEDGADPLQVAFAACDLLQRADRAICRRADCDPGMWLRRQGETVARLAAERDG